MPKNCSKCLKPIPEGRLKALPNTQTCTNCSDTEKVAGFMSWEHKTAPVLNITDAETAAQVYKDTRRKGTGVIPGLRMKGH